MPAAASAPADDALCQSGALTADDGPVDRRGLASLASREAQVRYLRQIAAEAQVDLTPAAAWLLVRLEQEPGVDPATLGATHAIDASRISNAIDELSTRGFVASSNGSERRGWHLGVTPDGCEALGRIVRVRRAHLAQAAAEFGVNGENTSTLRGIERELVPDARPTTESTPCRFAARRRVECRAFHARTNFSA